MKEFFKIKFNKDIFLISIGNIFRIILVIAYSRLMTYFLDYDQLSKYFIVFSIYTFFSFIIIGSIGTYVNRKTIEWVQDKTLKDTSELPILELGNDFNLMSVKSKDFPLTSSKFKETIRKLQESYEQVYVCTSNSEAILGLMALSEFNPTVVTIARLRKTKKADIKKIKSRHSIDILFYD